MRLQVINKLKNSFAGSFQELPKTILEGLDNRPVSIHTRDPLKRNISRLVSPLVVQCLQLFSHGLKASIHQPYDIIVGQRFSDASLSLFLKKSHSLQQKKILVLGCARGEEDVQFWLRRHVGELHGMDIAPYSCWPDMSQKLETIFGKKVHFRQAKAESLPYENGYFDLMTSQAVLEHVRNIPAAVAEMSRVLRSGGMAWHSIGPLYHSFSGDHCISVYGPDHGYDHLLDEDATYRQKLQNEAIFSQAEDPLCHYWAKTDQFSFYGLNEYLSLFQIYFDLVHVLLTLSPEGLHFRKKFPEKWRTLLEAGLKEEDLLVSGLLISLRKR